MPTFHFEAMDSEGEDQADEIQAANASEAEEMLRARGLFVTKLSEVGEGSDAAGSAESQAAAADAPASGGDHVGRGQTIEGQRMGLVLAAVGLLCAAVGLYGVIDSAWYGIRGKRVDAIVVDFDQSGDFRSAVLGFTVSGRQHRIDARGSFGVIWVTGHALGSRAPVLYMPDDPEDARLAASTPRFLIPLFLLIFGLALTGVGVLMRRHGWRPA